MTFISLQFLIFFMVVTLWFFRLKNQQGRILLLLIASCYFYMSFIAQYILILGGTIIVDYFAGMLIEKSEKSTRKFWLIISLIANIGTLAVFKYYNFFIDNIHTGFLFFGKTISLPVLKMALPIGLSFHTFQAMSYTIEVYRKRQAAERNFLIYALYVMFYPQLVAGPIERPKNVLPQLREFRPYNWNNVKEGLARMLWGFFKKAVIADRLAMVVDRTFAHTNDSSSLALFTGAVFYAFEIYCDFSGYSDIAIGAAKVMNIRLMENFDQPYLSRSISEFWRRWHISLSSWFYDYLYNPITTYTRYWGKAGIVFSLLVTFFISGLWHGAGWNFIVWGLLHGIALSVEFLTRKKRKKKLGSPAVVFNPATNTSFNVSWRTISGIIFTFIVITFISIFFRAANIADAVMYVKAIFSFTGGSNYVGLSRGELLFSALVIAIMLFREKFVPSHIISNDKRFYLYLVAMICICYFFGVFTENQFIYFQF